MPLNAPVKKTDYKPIDAGSYAARVYSVVDLGTHDATYEGKPVDPKRSIRITWELPTEMRKWEKDGQEQKVPTVIGNDYTLSLGKKANLRRVVECVIGTSLSDEEAKGFDVFDLVGMESLLSIVQDTAKSSGNLYAKIQSIAKLPKGMICPPAVNPTVKFNIGEWDQKVYEALPEFLRKKIDESHEKTGKVAPAEPTVFVDDETGQEIPF